jgi:Asp-tRNA(Asn)/Glu-tRNA(Gln) amidotransferase A subunit family amidase
MANTQGHPTFPLEAIRAGQMSLEDYLAQLEPFFEAENERIQAFLPEADRFARLRREAAALERQYPHPAERPPLYGLPVGVKDIFHVEGLETRAGSRLPLEVLAGPQAESVSRLKAVGALVLGKTVTTEFAYFGPGPTHNPHNPAHTPGGSSSGSAAAVAAGLCPLALGTQTIGSVVRPASFCGVIGFKPSYGRIDPAGLIPLSPSLDHVGFFVQDLALAEMAAGVLCAGWAGLPVDSAPLVLGVPLGPYLQKTDPEMLAHFETVLQKLAQVGFEICRVEVMPNFDDIRAQHLNLTAAEAAIIHRDWFEQYADLYHPKTAGLIQQGQQVSAEQLAAYRAGRAELRQTLTAVMTEHGLSAWVTPAAVGPAPLTLESTGDPVMNLPWTYAGLPALNLPAGFAANGLPLGLQLVAGWQEDEKLLDWANWIAPTLAR